MSTEGLNRDFPAPDGGPLFARTWRISGTTYPDQSTIDAILGSVLPRVQALPGYRGGYLLVERDRGAITTISFWDSLDAMKAADVLGKNVISGLMVVTAGQSMSVEVCDVLASSPPTARVLGDPGSEG